MRINKLKLNGWKEGTRKEQKEQEKKIRNIEHVQREKKNKMIETA